MDKIKITKDMEFDLHDLMLVVDADHEFTLRDILRACINSKIPIDVLSALLRCRYIEEYWQEAESKDFEDGEDIEYLELTWLGDKSNFSGVKENSSWWGFHGVGYEGKIPDDLRKNCDEKEIKKMEDEKYRQSYAIEFSPLYKLADYSIKVFDKMYITNWEKKPTDEFNEVIDLKPSITLMELLYWSLWELSFFGSVETRNKKCDEMDESCKEIDEAIKNGTIDQITKPIDLDKWMEEIEGDTDEED